MTTLNPPEDVELAEVLLKIHPWAGSVKYARTGGESMSIAVRLSRAFTGKDKILFCGYCEVCNKQLYSDTPGWIVNAEKKKANTTKIENTVFEGC